jgi:hypothetical protein
MSGPDTVRVHFCPVDFVLEIVISFTSLFFAFGPSHILPETDSNAALLASCRVRIEGVLRMAAVFRESALLGLV